MSSQTEILTETLTRAGHLLTRARRDIIGALVESGGHITADDLAAQINLSAPNVGRMTVYRTLDLLTELGLVRPIFQGSGAMHYILLAEGNHHHLICIHCNQVIEFDECGTEGLVEMLGSKFGFTVRSHLFEIYGICRECRD